MNKFFKWVGIIFVSIIVISVVAAIFSDKPSSRKSGTKETAANSTQPTQPVEPVVAWKYNSDTDKMTSRVVYSAAIEAKEELQLKFPYNGGSIATIIVRYKDGATDAYLNVTKGQIIGANPVEGGSIKVRFDDNKPETYGIIGSTDGSANYAFINSPDKFISKLKAAKRLLVEAEFYQDGLQQMEFSTQGFVWNHRIGE